MCKAPANQPRSEITIAAAAQSQAWRTSTRRRPDDDDMRRGMLSWSIASARAQRSANARRLRWRQPSGAPAFQSPSGRRRSTPAPHRASPAFRAPTPSGAERSHETEGRPISAAGVECRRRQPPPRPPRPPGSVPRPARGAASYLTSHRGAGGREERAAGRMPSTQRQVDLGPSLPRGDGENSPPRARLPRAASRRCHGWLPRPAREDDRRRAAEDEGPTTAIHQGSRATVAGAPQLAADPPGRTVGRFRS